MHFTTSKGMIPLAGRAVIGRRLTTSFNQTEYMNPRLALDAFVLLDAIERRGSFAAAAAELGRVPSAVTYAVRRLEDELDVLLFDRSGRRARLTPAGEELLREGRQLLAATDELARRVKRVASGWEQELRLAVDTLLPFEFLLPLIAEFDDRAPTRLRISEQVLGGTWDALLDGRADLAVGASYERPEASRHGASLRTEDLGRVQFVFAISAGHALASAPEPIPETELRRHRQVVVGDTSQRLRPRTSGLLGAETLTVPSMAAKIAAQVAGLGVGFLPRFRIGAELARGELVIRATEAGKREGPIALAWRAGHRGRALDWWRERLSAAPWRAQLGGWSD
jgi:DNA-binding transcriptional LysR family regulator